MKMYNYNNFGFNGGYNNGYQQPIQNVTQQTQSQASCFFVKSPEELAGVNIMPNVFYLGINRDKKEVYIRRMNNDGNIEVENYSLTNGKEEKNDLKKIMEEINEIKKKLGTDLSLGEAK